MSTIMDFLRNQCGLAGEEAADLIESLEKEIDILRDERDVITKERDELREQSRQHEAFQQWANASEQRRLNDARREGFRHAILLSGLIWMRETDDSESHIYKSLMELQPPSEWASSEQCGGAPNIEWKHPDGFGGGLMGEKE